MKRCDTCKHAVPVDESGGGEQGYQCRRYPPQAVAVPVPTKIQGQPPGVQITAVFPPMPGAAWCAEWEGRIDA